MAFGCTAEQGSGRAVLLCIGFPLTALRHYTKNRRNLSLGNCKPTTSLIELLRVNNVEDRFTIAQNSRRERRLNSPCGLVVASVRYVGLGEGFRMPAGRDLSSRTEGRRRKAPQEGTRGGWSGVCRLWGFGGAAACVRDARAGVGGGGATIAVGSLSSRRPLTGWFWHDRWRRTRLRRRRGDSDATAEARFPGRRVVR
jgi:hypothetical protein